MIAISCPILLFLDIRKRRLLLLTTSHHHNTVLLGSLFGGESLNKAGESELQNLTQSPRLYMCIYIYIYVYQRRACVCCCVRFTFTHTINCERLSIVQRRFKQHQNVLHTEVRLRGLVACALCSDRVPADLDVFSS